MLHCPYQRRRTQDEDGLCEILTKASGFIRSCSKYLCSYCILKQEWNSSPEVEQMNPEDPEREPSYNDAMKIIWNSQHFMNLFHNAMRCRLIGFTAPKYQRSNPIDKFDVFERYKTQFGQERAENLFREVIFKQVSLPEQEGGHPPETLENELNAVAQRFGMEHILQEETSDGNPRRENKAG